jgi:hypothetical protein
MCYLQYVLISFTVSVIALAVMLLIGVLVALTYKNDN